MIGTCSKTTLVKNLARLAAVMTVATGALLAPMAQAADKGHILWPGQSLQPGDYMFSPNKQFFLVQQYDGNLVLYRWRDYRPLWCSWTQDRAVRTTIMQTDGNLVIYGWWDPLWCTWTAGYDGSVLALQDDGNLVVYFRRWQWWGEQWFPRWSTGTQGQY